MPPTGPARFCRPGPGRGPVRQSGPGSPGPRQGPGGAIAAHLGKIKNRQEDAVIGRELDWQGRVEGDQAKSVAFRDQAVNQTTFRAFAFMKGRSPMVHMAHSVGQFFGMSGMAADVQGKYIGFIGDRGNGRHPVPFILPPQNAWAWTKIKFLNERNNFENHFEERENWDQRWTTGANKDVLIGKMLPRLLALPSFVAEYIQAQGGTCLPYHLYMYIRDHLDGDTTIDPERWRLILDWCIAAAQEKNDSSLLKNIGTPEPALCQDPEFLDWCERRLNFTLGEEVRAATVAHRGGEAWRSRFPATPRGACQQPHAQPAAGGHAVQHLAGRTSRGEQPQAGDRKITLGQNFADHSADQTGRADNSDIELTSGGETMNHDATPSVGESSAGF